MDLIFTNDGLYFVIYGNSYGIDMEAVPTEYSFHSWVDLGNLDKVFCSGTPHTDAGIRTVNLCI